MCLRLEDPLARLRIERLLPGLLFLCYLGIAVMTTCSELDHEELRRASASTVTRHLSFSLGMNCNMSLKKKVVLCSTTYVDA